MKNTKKDNIRKCDECTKCCEGWLYGEAYGHKFYKGRPCFFLDKKCTIYCTRPKDPCVNYKCEWLINDKIPAWLKPNISNVIISKKNTNNIEYYEIAETGKKMDSSVLNWLFQFSLSNKINILYFIDGGINRLGSEEFLTLNI